MKVLLIDCSCHESFIPSILPERCVRRIVWRRRRDDGTVFLNMMMAFMMEWIRDDAALEVIAALVSLLLLPVDDVVLRDWCALIIIEDH